MQAIFNLPGQRARRRWTLSGFAFAVLPLVTSAADVATQQAMVFGPEDVFLPTHTAVAPATPTPDAATARRLTQYRHNTSTVTNNPAYARLVRTAETALARGQTAQATAGFEHAERLSDDAPDAEMGMVRAYLQAGEYRRALSFATLTAGEHPGAWQAEALLAWIEFLGGQHAYARKRLAAALAVAPQQAALRAVDARLRAVYGEATAPNASALKLTPYGQSAPHDERLHGLASGVLVATDLVATSAATLSARSATLWVRNGLGQLYRATIERVDHDSGVALLRLARRSDAGMDFSAPLAVRVFPGSPAYVVEYPAAGLDEPAWPVLSAGFLGRARTQSDTFEQTVALPPGPHGGAVFDARGHLAGIVLPRQREPGKPVAPERIVPAATLRAMLSDNGGAQADDAAAQALSIQEIYERALPTVVTVLDSR